MYVPCLELVRVHDGVGAIKEPSGQPRRSAGVRVPCLPLINRSSQLLTCEERSVWDSEVGKGFQE